jgi:hypothetical protein
MSCHCFSRFFRFIYQFSIKISRFLAQTARKSLAGFLKTDRFIGVPGFTVPLSSPVHFDRIFSVFINFYRIFQTPDDVQFCSSADFSNTAVQPCKPPPTLSVRRPSPAPAAATERTRHPRTPPFAPAASRNATDAASSNAVEH